jgi:hypothetical protein
MTFTPPRRKLQTFARTLAEGNKALVETLPLVPWQVVAGFIVLTGGLVVGSVYGYRALQSGIRNRAAHYQVHVFHSATGPVERCSDGRIWSECDDPRLSSAFRSAYARNAIPKRVHPRRSLSITRGTSEVSCSDKQPCVKLTTEPIVSN